MLWCTVPLYYVWDTMVLYSSGNTMVLHYFMIEAHYVSLLWMPDGMMCAYCRASALMVYTWCTDAAHATELCSPSPPHQCHMFSLSPLSYSLNHCDEAYRVLHGMQSTWHATGAMCTSPSAMRHSGKFTMHHAHGDVNVVVGMQSPFLSTCACMPCLLPLGGGGGKCYTGTVIHSV